jgi:DnaJ-class molecular chaperone
MPRKLCPKCHGQRTISCPACHGTGKKTIANTSVSDCEECGRTGRRLCDVCSGTGEVEHLSVALNGS